MTLESPLQGAPAGAIAVTGSKGGVGKSNLALNLAVALGRCRRKVLLVDGDLGLANLDVLLGLVPDRTIEHLVRGEATLADLLIAGPEGVTVLPAASGVPQLTRLDGVRRRRLLSALSEAGRLADDVILDTGAGLSHATLALLLAASRVVVVTTPEPTSLVDAYASLKVLWKADPAKAVDLVVNAAESEEEAARAHGQIAKAAGHFLGREPGFLGSIPRDPKVGEAVRRQRAVLELYPGAPASRAYERIALRLAARDASGADASGYWKRLMEPELSEFMQ